MPTLAVDNFNIVCAVLGGFISLFGLVSYLLKEKFYISEALLATLFGILFSHAAGWIRPLEYANGNEENLETIILYFSRLALGVQLVLAGVQLPSKYLRTEWKSLAILLGPGMCLMWMATSLLVWALVPDITFLYALAVGACVTPTDPVLSNSIVKGKFADKNIPPELQKIIIAESGANDGLGYPFLFLALYLIQFTQAGGVDSGGNGGTAIAMWFYETWAYEILLSVAYGFVVGWLAKELLHWAEKRRYVDKESFLVFAITLALFIIGTMGMLGSDDVLACFIAGNAFTWDDWFRLETQDDSLQPTVDMLLNLAIFMWFGAVIPWYEFAHSDLIPIYRLIPLGILVLLLRRLPMVLLLHRYIHQIEEIKHAIFVGFFGPIGVSAVFYIYIAREFLATVELDGVEREDVKRLGDLILIVVWFLVACSILVHGLSIPFAKLGVYLPRTLSQAVSVERTSRPQSHTREDDDEPAPFHFRQHLQNTFGRKAKSESGDSSVSKKPLIPAVLARFGKLVVRDTARPHGKTVHGEEDGVRPRKSSSGTGNDESSDRLDVKPEGLRKESISAPMNPRILGKLIAAPDKGDDITDQSQAVSPAPSRGRGHSRDEEADATSTPPAFPWQRSIRFGEASRSASEHRHDEIV